MICNEKSVIFLKFVMGKASLLLDCNGKSVVYAYSKIQLY